MKAKIHWFSVAQLILCTLALFFLSLGALMLLILGIGALPSGLASVDGVVPPNPTPFFMMAGTLVACGLLLLPSIIYSIGRLAGWQPIDTRKILRHTHPALWILLLPPVLLLGYVISNQAGLAAALLPPLHILAVSIPVAWILYLSIRSLRLGSSQRLWGVFDSGLVLAPFFILIAEGIAAIIFLILGISAISNQQELIDKLVDISKLLQANQLSPEQAVDFIAPLLLRPKVIAAVMIFGAIIVPLIEEALKPAGVWLLAGHRLSAATGFGLGAVSGAGYALFESLVLSIGNENWTAMVVARMGTAAVHILTTAIMGWALVQTWTETRYGRLVITYLTVVLFHGTWNGITLYIALSSLAQQAVSTWNFPIKVVSQAVAPLALISMSVLALLALVFINKKLVLEENVRAFSNPSEGVGSEPEERKAESML